MKKEEMIESVKNYLFLFGEVDEKILNAIKNVDRKYFVSENPYLDTALPIGKNQTISQPSTVGRMLYLLNLKKTDNVLEIGTGSGWNAALIAYLTKKGTVTTYEIHRTLAKKAKGNLNKMKIKNVKIKVGDFKQIKKKFDKIIFTAGIISSQEKYIINYAKSFLKEEGILICPNKMGPLIILKKKNNKIKKTNTIEEYLFVPLIL